MSVTITALGAAGTVTGSKYLVEGATASLLIDAGLFQGPREWREKNWSPPPVSLPKIDAVLVTHAHIDHTGLLPRFVAQGLHAPVFASAATYSLSKLLLPDSGRLNEEEAAYRNEKGRSKHTPPLPLYTEADAIKALELFRPVSFHQMVEVAPGVTAYWRRMGHILGAGSIELHIDGKQILFSGDIGRYGVPILKDPEAAPLADLLVIESTYGDREHTANNAKAELARVINEASDRGDVVLIPSFAIGRTQQLLYDLRVLEADGTIPSLPTIVDSPMAADATELYRNHPEDYDEEALGILSRGAKPFSTKKLYFTRSRQDSMALNRINDPMIIISASGMLGGGRILHHLKNRIGDSRTTLLFVGFQVPGGTGAWLQGGGKIVKVMGEEIPVRARIETIDGYSGHAGRSELIRWCKSCAGKPALTLVTHGEPASAKAFAGTLSGELGWNVRVGKYLEKVTLE